MSSTWIVRLNRPSWPRARLLCIPQSGGGPATFRPLAGQVPADIDLLALRPPGRESRRLEPPVTVMDDLVKAVADALDEYLELPLALFGYCSGAFAMAELAREIHPAGQPRLTRLFACGACSPGQADRDRQVHAMPGAQLRQYLRAFGIMPAQILDDPDLFGIFEPVIRADFQVWEKAPYIHGPPLPVPITVIGGRADPMVEFRELLDWRHYTSDEFMLRLFPGGHDFFTTGVQALGTAIATDMLG
jgi:medium-chain acyl-[acyl-carrier-protein] hydrolase